MGLCADCGVLGVVCSNFEALIDKFQRQERPDSPILSDNDELGSLQSMQVGLLAKSA